ncbi:hypothetical protein A9Q84_18995 [Halobacteriovorax marinus]|uniref:histidine kinase n=1 Tax=Halobacteriovorax marinus TaxID=97084 RepID=A0A1Y5F288_9BACT|nr:hypothetical protein A9Q84_18995 [Halobacteriovorax marinus]
MDFKNLLTLFAQFTSKEDELEFRLANIHHYQYPSIPGILLMIIPTLFFLRSDYILFGDTIQFYQLLTCRFVFVAFSLVISWGVYKATSPNVHDRLLGSYFFFLVVLVLFITSTRPPHYTQHTIINAFIILTFYFVFITSLKNQFLAATTFTIGYICIIYLKKFQFSELGSSVTYLTFFLSNVLGFYISKRMNGFRRKEFRFFKLQEKLVVELKHANEYKIKMFSIISHDLRTPFNSLLYYSELLHTERNTYEKEELDDICHSIFKASHQAFDLLENLLSWSQIETHRLNFSPTENSLKKLIGKNIELFKESVAIKNISLLMQVEESHLAYFDVNMIDTVLRNLINNAIKFSNLNSSILIKVEDKSSMIIVSVIDSGVGINADAIEKIFKRDEFYTTDGTEDEKGTGLGISLCKDFVHENGGELWAKSNASKGTTLSFSLKKCA